MAEIRIAKDVVFPVELATRRSAIFGISGSGKRLALDTPLATPSGWTTMGEVQPGDIVFDEQGNPTKVTWIGPIAIGDSYAVIFSDGSEIRADAEHQWLTSDVFARRRERQKDTIVSLSHAARPQCQQRAHTRPSVRTTAQIMDTLLHKNKWKGGLKVERNHSIYNALPLMLPKADLMIDPYVLGVWLGDGNSDNGAFTTVDADIIKQIEGAGYCTRLQPSTIKAGCASHTILTIRPILRKIGVLNNKHIPQNYLRASIEQRRSLLQGLMDTDGGWGSSQAEFAVVNKELALGVYELVVSLGMKASFTCRPAKIYGRTVGTSYRVRFTPTMKVFRLKRKAERWRTDCKQMEKRKMRYIAEIIKIPNIPMRCISVDSPSHLYLAGRSMIQTHNSNTATRCIEELLTAGEQVVLVDPKGEGWGLQSSADGKRAGFNVIVFGQPHGDIPDLREEHAEQISDFVVDTGRSVVLSLLGFDSDQSERRFVTAFFKRFYRRKSQLPKKTRTLIVLDEAHLFIPEQASGASGEMVGAIKRIARQGRSAGIGLMIVDQRPQDVAKSVISQSELLICHQLNHKLDRNALMDWVKAYDQKGEGETFLKSLAELESGEAWVWSPAWLRIFLRTKIDRRHTYDSGATPDGSTAAAPQAKAHVDLDALRTSLAKVVEEAKANDPAALKKRIAELENELASTDRTPIASPPVEVPVLQNGELERLRLGIESLERLFEQRKAADETAAIHTANAVDSLQLQEIRKIIDGVTGGRDRYAEAVKDFQSRVVEETPLENFQAVSRMARDKPDHEFTVSGFLHKGSSDTRANGEAIPKGEMAILTALIQFGGSIDRSDITVLTGQKRSTRNAYIYRLFQKGYVENADPVTITPAGRKAIPAIVHLPTGAKLREHWANKLPSGERAIFEILVKAYPKSVSRESLSNATGFAVSTRNAYLSRMASKRLWVEAGDGVKASPTLF